jgi:acyl-CoA synthetase (NDP forming)
MAGSDAAVAALFHQSGVIRAATIDEMFDIAACLDTQPVPSGARVAVVTNGGGPGILAADACEGSALKMAALSSTTRERLASLLPATACLNNPVDMVAGAGGREFQGAIEAVLADPEVDALITIFTPVDATRNDEVLSGIAAGIQAARAAGARQKPVLACLMSASLRERPFRAGEERIPVYAFPEHAIGALSQVSSYAAWRAQPPSLYWDFEDLHVEEARTVCRTAFEQRGTGWLTFGETSAVLRAFGLPMAASQVAHSPEEAAGIARIVGYPVAAKIAGGSALQHKTDVGGVRLNLARADDVRDAYAALIARGREVAASGLEGVLIQPMIGGGIETIVGISHDPVFGPLIGFGLGGVDVELYGDVRFRIAPLTDRDADELLHDIRGFRLLQGYRGRPPADLVALRDVLLRVSRLAEEVPCILELDLNPVIALPPGSGCRIVDARIKIGTAVTAAESRTS